MASQYGIEEIVSSKRVEMEQKITDELTNKMGENNLVMVDFILRDIHFTDQYAAAVEQKQIAEQNALQAQFVVQQKKQEAEQARQTAKAQADAVVIAAQGEAQSIEIRAKAQAAAWAALAAVLRDHPEMLTYEYIQKIAPNLQVIYLPSGTPLLLPSVTPPLRSSRLNRSFRFRNSPCCKPPAGSGKPALCTGSTCRTEVV